MTRRAEFAPGLPALLTGAGQRRLEQVFRVGLRKLHRGRLSVQLPSGTSMTFTGTQDRIDGRQFHANWQLHSYRALRRMLSTQSVGFAESYVAGEWDSPDLVQLLELMACNMDALEAQIDRRTLVRAWNWLQHRFRANTRRGSRRNIAYHYDLGNDFYRAWLDEGMTYSAAYFDPGTDASQDTHAGLARAQQEKYRRLAGALDIRDGHKVLEIGCGWGGFTEFVAREYDCRVTAVTLSREQLDYARRRIARAGLGDRVEIRYQDYRDLAGRYDRIASIEMFEAVGEAHWGEYFDTLRACLAPDGRAALQIITIANERYENYRNNTDFIQKYVFPGGMLPSPERLVAAAAAAGLRLTMAANFGDSYARTLRLWRERFLRSWPEIARLGYSPEFRRLWEYYLAYCEAGFRHHTIDVGHYLVER